LWFSLDFIFVHWGCHVLQPPFCPFHAVRWFCTFCQYYWRWFLLTNSPHLFAFKGIIGFHSILRKNKSIWLSFISPNFLCSELLIRSVEYFANCLSTGTFCFVRQINPFCALKRRRRRRRRSHSPHYFRAHAFGILIYSEVFKFSRQKLF